MQKVGVASEEGTLIKSILEKKHWNLKGWCQKDQKWENFLNGSNHAASERGLEFVNDIKKEYVVSETMGEAPSNPSLIFPIHAGEQSWFIDFICKSIIDDSLREYEGVGWIKFWDKNTWRTATKRNQKHLESHSSINGYGLLHAWWEMSLLL